MNAGIKSAVTYGDLDIGFSDLSQQFLFSGRDTVGFVCYIDGCREQVIVMIDCFIS